MLPKKEIDYEKVDKILKLVGLDKKVNELPNKGGYNTYKRF